MEESLADVDGLSSTPPRLTRAAVAAVSLATKALQYLVAHEGETGEESWSAPRWRGGDKELLAGLVAGALLVGCKLPGKSAEEGRHGCTRLRTGMLALAAVGGDAWDEASERDEVVIGAGVTVKAMKNAEDLKRPRAKLTVEARAMCSWALNQPEVLNATSSNALCKTLKKFGKLGIKDKVVQTHYKSVMGEKEWKIHYGWAESSKK